MHSGISFLRSLLPITALKVLPYSSRIGTCAIEMQKAATHDNRQTNRDAVTALEQYDNWFLNNYSFTIEGPAFLLAENLPPVLDGAGARSPTDPPEPAVKAWKRSRMIRAIFTEIKAFSRVIFRPRVKW